MVQAKPEVIRSPDKTSFMIGRGRVWLPSEGRSGPGKYGREILIQDRQQPAQERNKLTDSTTPWRPKKQIIVSQARWIDTVALTCRFYGALGKCLGGAEAELSQKLDTGFTMAPRFPVRFHLPGSPLQNCNTDSAPV